MILVVHGLERFGEADLAAWKKHLSPQRLEKIDAYRFLPDKIASACAYLALRIVIETSVPHPFFPILAYTPEGKPYFADHPDVKCSLSHDRKGVCAAVSRDEIGVDVQEVFPYEEALAKRILTEAEQAKVAERDPNYLTWLWCMKESYGKQTGKGVYDVMQTTDFSNVRKPGFFRYAWNEGRYYVVGETGELVFAACAKEAHPYEVFDAEQFSQAIDELRLPEDYTTSGDEEDE